MAVYRDGTPKTLTNWRLYRDQFPNASAVNIGTEFAGRDAPKMKFLFTVEFSLGETLYSAVEHGSSNMGNIKYACKNVTRPNINVNMVDVNAYNYRFKVGTKVDYGTVTLTLYDDNKNYAHNLFLMYLNYISPVSLKDAEAFRLTDAPIQEWASLGPLLHTDRNGLIKRMRVTHHYTDTYADDGESSHRQIHYDYINPKIQQFALDELDMSISDANLITLTFVYDSVNVVYDTDRTANVSVGEVENI